MKDCWWWKHTITKKSKSKMNATINFQIFENVERVNFWKAWSFLNSAALRVMTMVTAWDPPVLTSPCCPSGSRWPSGSCERLPLLCSWHGLEHVLSWIIYYKCKRLNSTYWAPGTILSASHTWSQSMLLTVPGDGHIFNTISHFSMSRWRHRAVE